MVERKAASGIILILFLIGTSAFVFNIQPVKALATIYIRADGSVDPPTAPISSVDNITYTITGNIYSYVVVQRDNIVVNGAGEYYLLYGDGAYDSKGIDLTGRRNVTITNCRIQRFGHGIYLDSSPNNTILGNSIFGLPNNRVGISISSSKDLNILGNYIAQNGLGVAMSSCSNSTISENIIENNIGSGLHLEHLSNNTFSGNSITGHADYGILFYYSTNNTVSRNNIANNRQRGILLRLSSNNNSIHHNNFADNPLQVLTDCVNSWDSGYPSGGNYWSNYGGVDIKKGLDQNSAGSDGLGDTPYTINANNQDHYPLMNPFGGPSPPMHQLTVSASTGGTTDPSSGSYSYSQGQSVPVQAMPSSGYHLHHWELDGDNVGNAPSYTVVMDASHTLTAIFEPSAPPPVPEFPLGSTMPLAVIPLLLYLWWRRKQKTPQQ